MARTFRTLPLILLAVALAAVHFGCAGSSPEQKIAKIRSGYEVQLNTWQVLAPPATEVFVGEAGEEATAEAPEAAPAEGEEAAAEGEDMMAEPAAPVGVSIQLDLVVHLRGRAALAGITVDITHAAADQEEKAVYRQWVDTSNVLKGSPGQADFILEGIVMEEGDVFAASIAPGVPADLSAYREFSEAAP